MTDAKVELIDVNKEFPVRIGESSAVRAVHHLNLSIYDGEFFALLGPSGCGKTTTLRLIAGFEQPSSGQVLIDGKAMQGVPAFYRPVNTVFQDYALFPHMSVIQNVMFGLQMDKVPKPEAQRRAIEALELVRLPHALNRKPREMSGGQQQRVALARAIVKRPKVLLLDEPLGALDLKLRREMQYELKEMQQTLGITFVYVTHDQEEALTMANRIGVMSNGELLQVGRPEEIYESPATRFVADFIGETNFIDGKVIRVEGDYAIVDIEGEGDLSAVLLDSVTVGQQVTVAIRPEKIGIKPYNARTEEDEVPTATGVKALDWAGTALNSLAGHIAQVHYIGTDTRYAVRIGSDTVVNVRVQNVGLQKSATFKERDAVTIFWEQDSARVLTQ
ncbi:MAG: ABC transporter ATP-binding protein [Anaerolineae bacterium]|nr:ABC transporter ATP-binding protein [Chloroflexota bacterium]MBP6297948.1 ABC transporter ATP-binding protein [Anaerolineae bacterium]